LRTIDVTPSARRLTSSLRDIGYDIHTALADLVDNSVSADASRVDIELKFAGRSSYVIVADDGHGMTQAQLDEALRMGSRRSYSDGELGRYGLGMKTASLSLGRRMTVVTRHAPQQRRINARVLDLDRLEQTNRWEIIDPSRSRAVELADEWLDDGPGTVIVIEELDRILPEQAPEGGWARRRFAGAAGKAASYLGMVFHRFIEGEYGMPLAIAVNGEKTKAWNPFAPDEPARQSLPHKVFTVEAGDDAAPVWYSPVILPSRRDFSSQEEFERLSGPAKWNRQQGLYIYRSGRMIQSGGWSHLRAADEHTKLARAALEFDSRLDEAFRINIAKMRVTLPGQLRTMLERPVQELCTQANAAYRRATRPTASVRDKKPESVQGAGSPLLRDVAAALVAAAANSGQFDAFAKIMDTVRSDTPDVANSLGW
jgi:hypothetical protein